MTEAEALKQFIPILARISTPQERQIIARSIQTRIAGQDLRVMAVSHNQVGALAWPGDPVKASQFEESLNTAVDAGEFVSLLHRANQLRHLQIEELCAWPDCPAIALDSPLTFWLGEPAPEQSPTTPAPVVQGGTGTVWTPERKDSARAKMDELRGQGNKAFAKNTAAMFGVTPTRLREVLNDKPKKAPAKKAKGVWDV